MLLFCTLIGCGCGLVSKPAFLNFLDPSLGRKQWWASPALLRIYVYYKLTKEYKSDQQEQSVDSCKDSPK